MSGAKVRKNNQTCASFSIFILGRLRILQMFSNQFLHPNHIIPSSELLSTLMEMGYSSVAKLLMKADAVQRQVFILWLDE